MASDYVRELLRDDNSDAPCDGEVLTETREDILAIESGDLSGVAPWESAEGALAYLREQEARLLTRMGVRSRLRP